MQKQQSCFDNPSRDDIVLIRRWHVRFCEGNHCAAAILSYFDYWHSIKLEQHEKAVIANNVAEMHGDKRTQDESLFQFHTYDEISYKLMGMYGKNKISESIKLLEKRRAISIHRNPNPRYKFDNTSFFFLNVPRVEKWLISYKKHVISKVKRRSLKIKHEPLNSNGGALKEADGALDSNSLHNTVSSSLSSAVLSPVKEEAHFLESQNQQQEKPNAETLPTETRSDCAAPAPIGGMRSDSKRPEPSVAGAGVGEDFPSWLRYVMDYYGTRDEHVVKKHLKANDKGSELTGEKVAAWCARCGSLAEWLRSNVDGTFSGKTNGRAYSNGHSNGHANGNGKAEPQFKPVAAPAPTIDEKTLALMLIIAQVTFKNLTITQHSELCRAAAVELAKVGATCEIITAKFGANSWWYQKDWRGLKGSCPTPAQIVEVWGQWENTNGNGANGTNRSTSRNGFIPGRPCQWKGDDGGGNPKPVRTSKRTYDV